MGCHPKPIDELHHISRWWNENTTKQFWKCGQDNAHKDPQYDHEYPCMVSRNHPHMVGFLLGLPDMKIIEWPCWPGTDWFEVPIPYIFWAYFSGLFFREYPHKIWSYMVRYLQFRILKFPLIPWAMDVWVLNHIPIIGSLQDHKITSWILCVAIDLPIEPGGQPLNQTVDFRGHLGHPSIEDYPLVD